MNILQAIVAWIITLYFFNFFKICVEPPSVEFRCLFWRVIWTQRNSFKDVPKEKGKSSHWAWFAIKQLKRQEMRYQSSKVLKFYPQFGHNKHHFIPPWNPKLASWYPFAPPKIHDFSYLFPTIQGTHLLPAQDEGLSMAELQGRGNFYHATE